MRADIRTGGRIAYDLSLSPKVDTGSTANSDKDTVFFWKSKSAIIDAESAKQMPLAEQRVPTLNGGGWHPQSASRALQDFCWALAS
jgi:hypothetical protein